MVFARIGLRYRYLPLLLLGLLWSTGDARAATIFSEYTEIAEDTVWTTAESPYVILDNVTVDVSGADLEIEPGVVVKLGRRSNLDIDGTLVAEGTESAPIIFTSLHDDAVSGDTNGDGSSTAPRATDDWGISVTGAESSLAEVSLEHVQLSYSRRGLYAEDAALTMRNVVVTTSGKGVEMTGGLATVNGFTAEDIAQDALLIFEASAMLNELVFTNSVGYGLETFFSDITVDTVTCENLAASCIYTYGGSADVRNVWVKSTDANMQDVALTFYDTPLMLETVVVENIGARAGLGIYDTEAVVKDVILSSGLGYGLELIGFSEPTAATMENISVTGFAPGMYLSNVDLNMDGANVTGNNGGIETDMATEGDVVLIRNATIADNTQFGVYDYSDEGYVDVRENWWGDPSGPFNLARNPGGTGNAVVGNALFDDWLLIPPGEPEEPTIDPLLLQYMPVLYMHPEEDYFPMNVEAFVEGSAIWDDRDLLSDRLLVPAGEGNAATLEYIATTTDTSDWYIQFSGSEAKEFDLVEAKARFEELVNDGKATTTVYVHKMEDSYVDDTGNEHEFIVLQYWYFYAMNNWQEKGGFNNHEGDWESVFIFLDKETEEPVYAAFSAHHNDGDPSLNVIQYGSVRREWTYVELVSTKPVSYVSLGSHANYGDNGNDGKHNAKSGVDLTSFEGSRINHFVIKDFDFAKNGWQATYKGKWGSDSVNLFGSDGPQGPNFNNISGVLRFHEPIKWAGIDTVSEQKVETESDTLRFSASGVVMKFKELLSVGTNVSSALYQEAISFGDNLEQINFMPRYWEFETSLSDETFEVEVTVPYDKAPLQSFGVSEEWLTAYYLNEETNVWEAVPSVINQNDSEVTFTTSHFSRYALGSPVLVPVANSTLKVDIRPGRFNQALDTREYVLTLTNTSTTTFTGTLRVVVKDISLPGAQLLAPSGTNALGQPYVDVNLSQPILAGQQLTTALEFKLPTEVKANSRANTKAQRPNSNEKKVNFEVAVFVF